MIALTEIARSKSESIVGTNRYENLELGVLDYGVVLAVILIVVLIIKPER